VLTRGYAIVSDESGKPLRSVDQVRPGERIMTKVKDGIIESTVTGGRKENSDG